MDLRGNLNIGEENFLNVRLKSRSIGKNKGEVPFLDMEKLWENSLLGES